MNLQNDQNQQQLNCTQTKYLNNKQLFKSDNYSFRILCPDDLIPAHEIVSTIFHQSQPHIHSFNKQFSSDQQLSKQQLASFLFMWMDNATTNSLSIGVVDIQNNDELVATLIAKDFIYLPNSVQERFMKHFNSVYSVMNLQNQLIKQIQPKLYLQNKMKEKGIVLDIFAVAIKKEHNGKGLLRKMIQGCQMLGKKQGYQYSFIYATNYKTGKAASHFDYYKLAETDSKEFQLDNVKPFLLIEQQNRFPSIWLKNL